ncbi:MAG TPA: TetR/AcrR family transcriptional regulator [Solirubrobacterales bacterium]|nr:TetR/AcrR family transcriptional regulator [Solirubrobacterales bacterium]
MSEEKLAAAIGNHWPPAQIDAAVELLSNSNGKFPSGVRKLPSDLVSAVQRERLIAAMLQAASELGYRGTNVQDVIERAGVSRPTFYEHFTNKEDCFLASFDVTASRLRERIRAASEKGVDSWRNRLRYGLETLLHFVATEPEAARMLIVEARAASPEAVMRRDELLDDFASCIDAQVREYLPTAPAHSAITSAGIVGGVEALLYSRLNKGELDDLDSLLPSMMYFLVLPYEGHEAASEELAAAVR